MSKFTDYFPTAGGGGSTISNDPSTMDRNVVARQQLVVHQGNGVEKTSALPTFWDCLITTLADSDPIGSYVSMPSNSQAYQTIVDLSYPGVGGKLFNVIGPCLVSGYQPLCTFKITIDGTATEIEYMMIFNDARPLLGDFLTGRLTASTTYPGGVSIGSTNTFNSRGGSTGARGAFNGFSNLSLSNVLLVPSTFSGFSYITFEDTCKVEIKHSYTINQSNERNNAAALYLLN
tara:strand:+ start:18 stop:713 length:696 start_codon:yes stop_codon:yes gene_type:complete